MVGCFLVFLWEIVLNGWKRVIGLYLLNLIVYVVLVFFVLKCKYVFFFIFFWLFERMFDFYIKWLLSLNDCYDKGEGR